MVARRDNEGVSKPLFKRKRGLSKFYANKAQSFSSLDHALSTCMGHSALALEKPRPRTHDASPRSDVDVEVTSRARNLLYRFEGQNGSLQQQDSMTSALCTVLEQSSLSHCDSDNTSISLDWDMHAPRQKSCFESSHPGQLLRDTTSCPLLRSDSEQSIEVVVSRRVPSLELPNKAT